MNDYQILHNAPEGATHFDGKTYFRFEMFEHGQAYLVLKNGVWDRGLPAYPVYSCRCLSDIAKLIKWYQGMDNLKQANNDLAKAAIRPDGYVLVPVEPTEKMVEAGIMFHSQFDSSVPRVYKAMIQETQEQE